MAAAAACVDGGNTGSGSLLAGASALSVQTVETRALSVRTLSLLARPAAPVTARRRSLQPQPRRTSAWYPIVVSTEPQLVQQRRRALTDHVQRPLLVKLPHSSHSQLAPLAVNRDGPSGNTTTAGSERCAEAECKCTQSLCQAAAVGLQLVL